MGEWIWQVLFWASLAVIGFEFVNTNYWWAKHLVLRLAIRRHRSQRADDRCIEDDDRLYEALGDGIKCDRQVGDQEAMFRNCKRFITNRTEGGHWPTYVELEAEIAELKRIVADSDIIFGANWQAAMLAANGNPHDAAQFQVVHLAGTVATLEADIKRLQALNEGLVERCAKQSDQLTKLAEKGAKS